MPNHADLLESLAALEHRQWMHWSQAVASQVPPQVLARWREAWVPYAALPDPVRELDRVWARQVLKLLREQKVTP